VDRPAPSLLLGRGCASPLVDSSGSRLAAPSSGARGLASSVPGPARPTRPLRRFSTRRPPLPLLPRPSSSSLGTRPGSSRLYSRCQSRDPLLGSWTPAPLPT
jgi:hypothetical protein